MIAYKFLAPGAVGPFTGFSWPVPSAAAPGRWVEAPDRREEHGIHACRERDLAFWLDAELWRAELADPVTDAQRQVISPRARLLERIVAWDGAAARAFAEACLSRARELCAAKPSGPVSAALSGYLAEATEFLEAGDPACSAYISARSAVVAAGGDEDAFGAEREQQGILLARLLRLAAPHGV
ncbi:MAG TPA: hypothetical protein VFP65_12480 [Anaeromyxobacteraceae bacterium]|nr:hypothetical protein [Anaeromyxobacteraceae bacterium]